MNMIPVTLPMWLMKICRALDYGDLLTHMNLLTRVLSLPVTIWGDTESSLHPVTYLDRMNCDYPVVEQHPVRHEVRQTTNNDGTRQHVDDALLDTLFKVILWQCSYCWSSVEMLHTSSSEGRCPPSSPSPVSEAVSLWRTLGTATTITSGNINGNNNNIILYNTEYIYHSKHNPNTDVRTKRLPVISLIKYFSC